MRFARIFKERLLHKLHKVVKYHTTHRIQKLNFLYLSTYLFRKDCSALIRIYWSYEINQGPKTHPRLGSVIG